VLVVGAEGLLEWHDPLSQAAPHRRRHYRHSLLVATALAERLGDAVHLEAPVNRVDQRNGYVLVEAGAGTVKAERELIALRPTFARRITYDPPLPSHRDPLMQRLPQGTATKVNVV